MAKRFEELECWSLAVELDKVIFQFIMDNPIKNHLSIKDQMLRSVGSIADNIAEGFERGGNKEFIQFLYVAKGSCGELRSQLHRARGRDLISERNFQEFSEKCLKVSGKISNLISYLKNSDYKGEKYN